MNRNRLLSRVTGIICALTMSSILGFAQTSAAKAKATKEPAAAKTADAVSANHDLVDLNSARKEQLMTIPGIGDAYKVAGHVIGRRNNLVGEVLNPFWIGRCA